MATDIIASRETSAFGAACVSLLPNSVRTFFAVREMAKRSTESLQERKYYLRYADRSRKTPAQNKPEFGPVWQYWHAGFDSAPEVIQKCFASVARWTDGRERILLTDKVLDDYVDLPGWVMDKRETMGATHFSDILRVNLLRNHGGTWIDASVFLSNGIEDLTNLPFFAFSRPNDPYMLSSWFMNASKQHVIPQVLGEMLSEYWKFEKSLRDYFAIHYMFEVALTTNSQFRAAWLNTPILWHTHPHWLQGNFQRHPDVQELKAAMSTSAVHKLSYKFDEPVRASLANCIDKVNEILEEALEPKSGPEDENT